MAHPSCGASQLRDWNAGGYSSAPLAPVLAAAAADGLAPAFPPVARAALARIPPAASVVAQSPIVPHLSHRDRIYMLDETFPDADVVITAAVLAPWPLAGADDVARQLEAWRARGYRTVFDRDGWTVLMR